ncbi:hypothetical protein B296_00024256 [Ensete ventricosum]|uniref:Uncharacterized protein n=1 Tax=Ensete ventricosum TaxID=4639 RepID=A0A426ZQZ0_ENSVE|nr:hypothetical protein B296_00024256 [Ensete ventricosum]
MPIHYGSPRDLEVSLYPYIGQLKGLFGQSARDREATHASFLRPWSVFINPGSAVEFLSPHSSPLPSSRFSPSSSGGSNFGGYSPSELWSSMDEKSSKVLEAMLKEHDEDSVVTRSPLPKIRATYRIPDNVDLHALEAGQHPFDPFPNGPLGAGMQPSEELVENVAKNLATALKKVKSLEKQLQGLKKDLEVIEAKNRETEKFLLVALAEWKMAENDLAAKLNAAPEKAQAIIAQYKESPGFKYEFGYKIALTRFRTKHSRLEVEEDPYAILPEDNNVSMEVDVPFDDSDPLTM